MIADSPPPQEASARPPTTNRSIPPEAVDGEAAVATVEAYFAAYAAGDVDGAMSHFSTDPPATITFCFVEEGCNAPGQFSMEAQRHLIAHNVAEGTENHVWRSASGEEFCAVGHTATIADGRIVGWQWPSDLGP